MEFVYLEGLIAAGLGVSQATLRKGRKLLEEGLDWALVEHGGRKRVAYSYAGALAVLSMDGVGALDEGDFDLVLESALAGPGACAAAQADMEAVQQTSAPETVPDAVLVVERLTKNRRILMCELDASWIGEHGGLLRAVAGVEAAGLMRVKVSDTAKFIKGMAVECRHVQSDLWECTQRMPRWKGRY